MTDDRSAPGDLGPSPTPNPEAREDAIAGALSRFDELIVDGRLTAGAPATETPATDELVERRAQRRRSTPTAKRWLGAAAVVAVVGLGGVAAVGLLGSSEADQSTQASGQAEQTGVDDAGPADQDAGAGHDEAAAQDAPERGAQGDVPAAAPTSNPAAGLPAETVEQPSPTFKTWVCDLLEYFSIDLCRP